MTRRVIKGVLTVVFTALFLSIIARWTVFLLWAVLAPFGVHVPTRPLTDVLFAVLAAVVALRGRPVRAWWHRARGHQVATHTVSSDIGFMIHFRCSCGREWWRVGADP